MLRFVYDANIPWFMLTQSALCVCVREKRSLSHHRRGFCLCVVAVVLHSVFELFVSMVSLHELRVVSVVAARPHQDAHKVQGVAQVL